jgi:hypothetical protein
MSLGGQVKQRPSFHTTFFGLAIMPLFSNLICISHDFPVIRPILNQTAFSLSVHCFNGNFLFVFFKVEKVIIKQK